MTSPDPDDAAPSAAGQDRLMASERRYGEPLQWQPGRVRLSPVRVLLGWLVSAASIEFAAWLLPGVELEATGAALAVAAAIAVFNAILPPVLAALRLPFTLLVGFLAVLFADALLLLAA